MSEDKPIYYAGIGSRQTPPEILDCMRVIGYVLAKSGLVLRSGAAEGADAAFEKGCDAAGGKKEIYLPWNAFNGKIIDGTSILPFTKEAMELASHIHPAWANLSEGGKRLHSRNCHQVLGKDVLSLTALSRFVICWTAGTGGTEQALRLARQYGVPIINLYKIKTESILLSVFRTISGPCLDVRNAPLE